MIPKIESKLPQVGVTIFTTMSKLALEQGAINLSQGFPDFDAHPDLIEQVAHHMRQGSNQYAPMQGIPILRERIAQKSLHMYGVDIDPETEITVTSGATEALFAAITAVVQPGDEVLLVEPAYDSYLPAVVLSGGIPRFVQLKHPDYRIDWDEFKDALSNRTRAVIINSPHNPTGTVLSTNDIGRLAEVVRDRNIILISDEVYEHIIFDGLRHESLLRHDELRQRSFVISSFGKTYHTTGWKIGYCIAPERLTREFQKIHQYVTFASNTPIQFAYADFLERKELFIDLAHFYQKKRDLFLDLIKDSRFKPLPCQGTYFIMLDYSAVSDQTDTEFARTITCQHKVAAIPPSVFYHKGEDNRVLRFCFAKKDETLMEAAKILRRI
jgi:methionine aminotransferase